MCSSSLMFSFWISVAWIAFAILGGTAAWIDVREHRLPNRLTFAIFLTVALLLLLDAVVVGEWNRSIRAITVSVALTLFYLALHLATRGGMGMGDVKLAAGIGLLVGHLGWNQVVIATFAAFAGGALSGFGLLATRRGGLKARIPFGPWMVLGAFVSLAPHLA
jgi:leader peptidase (prepilin peptidase) / N-methyltransferase